MRAGLAIMIFTVVIAVVSFIVDLNFMSEFSWFSASGAVMVSGSILFERLKPGTGLDGGSNFMSLPKADQKIHPLDKWLMKNGGRASIAVLIAGTLIWAYGSLLFV
jgi:hypothetical protein